MEVDDADEGGNVAAALLLGVEVADAILFFRRRLLCNDSDRVEEADEEVEALDEDEVKGLRIEVGAFQVGSG